MNPLIYTCKGKGGRYRIVGHAHGAGTSHARGAIVVYQDVRTGEMFYRTEDDFANRMEPD